MKVSTAESEKNEDKLSSTKIHQAQSSQELSSFVDNRPTAIAQRKLQENANESSVVNRTSQLQAIADNFTQQDDPVQRKENNTGLPDNLKTGIENLSGYSMNDVKVHYNSDKPAQLQAHAYAQGTDIHLGTGQEKHLPHEAWHVVQQKQGRVQPTKQMKGKINVNDDSGLEKEADVMGQNALKEGEINSDTNQMASESYDSNLTQFMSTLRDRTTVQMEPGDEDMEPDMTPREAIGREEDLSDEDIQALQELNGTSETSILKFNFAGSGEKAWKTHKKEEYKRAGKDFGEQDSTHDGKKYKKEKETIGGHKTVFEYAGPIKKTLGKKGVVDGGENSTENNLADAKMEIMLAMNAIKMTKLRGADPKVEVNIKGFSRGAATATVFANWIKENYPDVPINLVAIDPVHGTGSWDDSKKGTMGKMDSQQDLSAIDNSTYVLPIQSGHWGSNFTPQRVFNYSRVIIMYGPNVKHSMGMGGLTGSVLTYNGQPIKGTQLGTLPTGLLVADSTDPENIPIQRINTLDQWESVSPRIMGGGYIKKGKGKNDKKVNAKEKRDIMVSQALEQFIANGQVKEHEMFDNPMHSR